jgi:hypothetical protein
MAIKLTKAERAFATGAARHAVEMMDVSRATRDFRVPRGEPGDKTVDANQCAIDAAEQLPNRISLVLDVKKAGAAPGVES